MAKILILALAMFGVSHSAIAQTSAADSAAVSSADEGDPRWVTVRLQARKGMAAGCWSQHRPGMESRFWYVDAGWRLHRMKITYDTIRDVTILEARDLFASEADVRDFLRARDADFTGAWARIGLAFRFGRKQH